MGLGKTLKRGATGVATGGASEWGPGGALWGGGGTETQSQGPLETPEQRAARQMLLKYATTGQVGGITAGQDVGITPGDYSMTGTEQTGLGQLNDYITSAMPEGYGMANDSIRGLLDTSTSGLDTMFSPYKALAEREQRTAEDTAKRSAGFMGNLYSTDTVRKLGDVSAKTAEGNMATLAGLTNDALNRRLSATGLAQTSGSLEEQSKRNKISDAMQFGALQRDLNNQRVQDANAEKLRRRQEIMGQLDAAGSVSGSSVPFGVKDVQVAKPNPYMDFLQLIVSGGSRLAGASGGRTAAAPSPAPKGYAPWAPTGNRLSLY
jgi:hypothetical protein